MTQNTKNMILSSFVVFKINSREKVDCSSLAKKDHLAGLVGVHHRSTDMASSTNENRAEGNSRGEGNAGSGTSTSAESGEDGLDAVSADSAAGLGTLKGVGADWRGVS